MDWNSLLNGMVSDQHDEANWRIQMINVFYATWFYFSIDHCLISKTILIMHGRWKNVEQIWWLSILGACKTSHGRHIIYYCCHYYYHYYDCFAILGPYSQIANQIVLKYCICVSQLSPTTKSTNEKIKSTPAKEKSLLKT